MEVLLALRGTLNVANLEAVYEDETHVHLVRLPGGLPTLLLCGPRAPTCTWCAWGLKGHAWLPSAALGCADASAVAECQAV